VSSDPRNRLTDSRPLSDLAWVTWLVFFLAAALALAWLVPRSAGSARFVRSIPLHIFLETCAVAIAILIFALGWNTHTSERAWNLLFFYSAFLVVPLIDFGHMLSFPGIPQFTTPARQEKSLLRRTIERHGGQIWAEAAPDKGATFYFTVIVNRRSGANGSGGPLRCL
jgi:hypothetical protein